MVAKIDTDPTRDWWEICSEAFDQTFLSELGAEFGFDPIATNAKWWVHKAGVHYLRGRRAEDFSKPRELRAECENTLGLCRELTKFLTEPKSGFTFLSLHDAAKEIGVRPPYYGPEQKPDHLWELGAHDSVLKDLVKVLDRALEIEIGMMNPDKGGRPSNLGMFPSLEYLAEFWESQLVRRYTLDHHKGTGLTPAFNFSKKVILRLDDVPESQLITGMRKVVGERRDHINRPKKS